MIDFSVYFTNGISLCHNRAAYISDPARIDFRRLIADAEYYGDLLSRQGEGPVAVFCDRSIAAYTAIFSCLRSGRPLLPVSRETGDEQLRMLIKSTGCELLIGNCRTESGRFFGTDCLPLRELTKYRRRKIHIPSSDTVLILYRQGERLPNSLTDTVTAAELNALLFDPSITEAANFLSENDLSVLCQAPLFTKSGILCLFLSFAFRLTLVDLHFGMVNRFAVSELINRESVGALVGSRYFASSAIELHGFNSESCPRLKYFFLQDSLEAARLHDSFPDCRLVSFKEIAASQA